MVDYEIVVEDSGSWLGSWGDCIIDQFVISRGDSPVISRCAYSVFEVLEKCLSPEEYDKLPESEFELKPIIEKFLLENDFKIQTKYQEHGACGIHYHT